MPKAYWIARVDIHVPDRYGEYVAAAKPAFENYGGVFLARGGEYEALEGPARKRNVVIEFPSMEAAIDCYNSSQYRAAAAIRQQIADGEFVVVAGC